MTWKNGQMDKARPLYDKALIFCQGFIVFDFIITLQILIDYCKLSVKIQILHQCCLS